MDKVKGSECDLAREPLAMFIAASEGPAFQSSTWLPAPRPVGDQARNFLADMLRPAQGHRPS